MNCKTVRSALTASRVAASAEVVRHVERCVACGRFARRIESVRLALRAHHAGVEPDAGFAARVASRLDTRPGVEVGIVALRLLPAGLAVLLVLALWVARAAPVPDEVALESPTDDVLAWVLETEDAQP